MNICLHSITKTLLFISLIISMGSISAEDVIIDIEKNLGPKSCSSCHMESARAWKKTQHYKTYKEIPRKRIAKKRAKKMRFRQIKTDSLCVNCHFTAIQSGSRIKTVAGISCESCHGGSKEWIDSHSDFGGRGVRANEETPEHKMQRQLDVESKGMIPLTNIYHLAKNCYRCHTVPEEKLVNIGRHPAGSDFELIQWGQGDVRHNLWHDESSNSSLPIARLRIMFVVGKALDLEYAFRGLAKASVDSEYFQQMVLRKENALRDLQQLGGLIDNEEINNIIALVSGVEIQLNRPEYQIIADKIGELNKTFSIMADGNAISALDTLLPDSSDYKGSIYQP